MRDGNSRRVVWLCMAVFFVQPIQFGVWLSRIAEVKLDLALSNVDLAFGLLGMPFGLMPTLYFAGKLVDRTGPRRTLLLMFPPMLVAGMLPGLATGTASLFLALFLLGGLLAFTQVALNVYAARVEKSLKTSVMNSAHGFWSLGMMAGSLIGVQMAGFNFSTATSLLISGLILMPILMTVAFRLPGTNAESDTSEPRRSAPPIPKALWLIIVAVFGATIVEGAMVDWSTVYMRDVAGIMQGKEGLAVTVFAGFVTVGRFVGNSIDKRFGQVFLARACIGMAISGLIVLVLDLGVGASYVAFALIGLGVSTIFPLGVSASAALDDVGEARNVSLMTFGSLIGFLVGPPMIGFVSEKTALNLAFALLLPTIILSFILARRFSRL